MVSGSGSIQRRRLGIELRELRTAKGLTLEEVAEQFGWSVSKASRMERGRVPVSPRDVKDLARLYNVEHQKDIDALVAMAATSRQRDWWHKYDDLHPRQFSVYLGFETDASAIHNYETIMVPGLLQTPDYAEEIFRVAQPQATDHEIERRIEARVLRQTLVLSDNPPKLWMILDEAVLRRVVAGPAVMRTQLAHLLEAGARDNITIQVIPFAAGAYMAMDGGFVILRFDTEDPDIVSIDGRTRNTYMDDPVEVQKYGVAFEQLLSVAATPEHSAELIAAVMKELK